MARGDEFREWQILIVDDNETSRKILTRLAASWGMMSVALGAPLDAIDVIRNGEHFDLAIIDMVMPDMDGASLSRAIRQLPNGARLPIILLTSAGARPPVEGIEKLVTRNKPIKPSLLFDAVKQVAGDGLVSSEATSHDEAIARLRVLLADDSNTNQQIGVRMLGRLGCRVDVVSNGVEALTACAAVNYDVVLMDVQMPVLDGLAATQEIRRTLSEDRQPWVIALTAGVSKDDREQCRNAGMDDFLAKPVRLETLRDVLEHASEQRTRTVEAVGSDSAPRDQILDLTVIAEFIELTTVKNPHFLATLLESYRRDAAVLVDEIERDVAAENWIGARRAAHTLRGTSATIGAIALPEICAQMANVDDDPSQGLRLGADIRRAHEELLEVLAANVTGL